MNENFDWVNARCECSLAVVFQQLKMQIDADVEQRNLKRSPTPYYAFSVTSTISSITVMLNGNGIQPHLILLKLGDKNIAVYDDNNQLMFEASLTLSDDGQCRLKIKDQEKEFWQFRRMALEKLFFESVPREEF
jgi:hypothetical protein